VNKVKFTEDGKYLVSIGGYDNSIVLWKRVGLDDDPSPLVNEERKSEIGSPIRNKVLGDITPPDWSPLASPSGSPQRSPKPSKSGNLMKKITEKEESNLSREDSPMKETEQISPMKKLVDEEVKEEEEEDYPDDE
jgi:WD40 repeat protein